MFGDFIFALLEVEQPENLERVQVNPKKRKVQENLAFQDYGDGGRNDTFVANAFELRKISSALWVMD